MMNNVRYKFYEMYVQQVYYKLRDNKKFVNFKKNFENDHDDIISEIRHSIFIWSTKYVSQ